MTEMDWTDSPVEPNDTMLPHYLIATWAKVCQAMGPELESYLPVMMPLLFLAANAKADVSVYGWFGRLGHHQNGWSAGSASWDPDISSQREVTGVRDTASGDLLFHARRTVRTIPATDPGGGVAIVTIRSS